MAGIGVLQFSLPVPADGADIKLAIEDAGADGTIAPYRAVVPALATGAGYAVAVEVGGDALWSLARDIFAEDAPHDLGLFGDNLAFAPYWLPTRIELVNDAIAIGIAAADLAGLDTAPDAPMGLDGEVFQEQGIHRALEADMEFVDLAFGEGEDGHTGKA